MENILHHYFFLIFLAAWLGISFLLSLLSGWWQLSQYYRSSDSFEGRKFYFQSAAMRLWANYNNVLILGVSSEGFYLSILFPFRIGHPSLLVQWEDISCVEKPGRLFGGFKLHFAKCPSIPMVISRRLMKKIAGEVRERNKTIAGLT